MDEGIECKRCYLKIVEHDWIKEDVVPWNPTDPEDCGYRDCPAYVQWTAGRTNEYKNRKVVK